MREALKIINSEDEKIEKIYTTQTDNFNHFISNYKFTKKNNYDVKKLSAFKERDSILFAILCLNNPRFALGKTNLPDDPKCIESAKKENFYFLKTKKIPDFIIHFVEYKN